MKETKYLGMMMDEHLTLKKHMDTVKLKLNTANGLLAKVRHYVNAALLPSQKNKPRFNRGKPSKLMSN